MRPNTTRYAPVPFDGSGTVEEPPGDASAEEILLELRSLEEGSAAAVRLKERIVAHYRPLLNRIARRYGGRGEEIEDLRQTAHLGLVKAIQGFDPGRGKPFVSYLLPTVTGEIKRHFRDHTWSVHTPRAPQARRPFLRQARQDLEQRLCRQPSNEEIAQEMGVTVADVEETLLVSEAYNTFSLSAPDPRGEESSNALERYMGVRDPGLDLVVDRQAARSVLTRLTPRERLILRRRYFDGWKQARIAGEVGCSQMHVSRLLSGALEWMRAELSEGDAPPKGSPRS
ncbi:sigma-70 family RNA polymerase sigma factor [Nocardiopsis sp. SBT366]|uniref:sigma-70 family RNA polymerase sigma factor n=1 Tax=Nocardiopsis sp. SBT366 TaxID=1580529 RepID=UPI00066A9802|nr:sigma-70 family RNA polymerase sigma factor [Nocardiopsis sp. SBT366]